MTTRCSFVWQGSAGKAGGRETEAAQSIRAAAPHAHPNRRIVALADAILGLEGRLIAAREAMGPAEPMTHGPLVRLPLLGGSVEVPSTRHRSSRSE
jgi:hypothetical protein